jgi:hypothetical protein
MLPELHQSIPDVVAASAARRYWGNMDRKGAVERTPGMSA